MDLSCKSSQVSFTDITDDTMHGVTEEMRKIMTRTPKGHEYCACCVQQTFASDCIFWGEGHCNFFPQMFPKLQKIPKVH